MRPVSAAWAETVRGSHRMVADARVVQGFPTGVNPPGTVIPILSGDVQMDGTADIRSNLSLVTDGDGMWPRVAADLLAPYGNEVFVRRGIDYGAGSIEWVSLGYFRIDTIEQDEAPDPPILITGSDRMAGIVDARLTAPKHFPAATTLGTVVSTLVTEVYPSAVIEWDDTTNNVLLGRDLICEENRHGFLDDLIRARGKIWYWDHRGILLIRTAPDPGSPVFTVSHGAGGVLVRMGRQITRHRVYNAVVAFGEAADTQEPVRAVMVDLNPQSPTFWNGSFGKVPRFYSSPFITTEPQAQSAAEAMLARSMGLPYNVDFTAVPNAALEPDDPVKIRYPRGGYEIHVLQRLTIPLVAREPMRSTTREKTLVLIGRP